MSVQNSEGTWVRESPEEVVQGIANLCAAQHIHDDAGWLSYVTAAFNSTNAPGLSAGTRQLLIAYYSKNYRIGGTP